MPKAIDECTRVDAKRSCSHLQPTVGLGWTRCSSLPQWASPSNPPNPRLPAHGNTLITTPGLSLLNQYYDFKIKMHSITSGLIICCYYLQTKMFKHSSCYCIGILHLWGIWHKRKSFIFISLQLREFRMLSALSEQPEPQTDTSRSTLYYEMLHMIWCMLTASK